VDVSKFVEARACAELLSPIASSFQELGQGRLSKRSVRFSHSPQRGTERVETDLACVCRAWVFSRMVRSLSLEIGGTVLLYLKGLTEGKRMAGVGSGKKRI